MVDGGKYTIHGCYGTYNWLVLNTHPIAHLLITIRTAQTKNNTLKYPEQLQNLRIPKTNMYVLTLKTRLSLKTLLKVCLS